MILNLSQIIKVTWARRTALTNLIRNKDIIIKSADKGGQICIQDKENYLEEAYRHNIHNLKTVNTTNRYPTYSNLRHK